MFLTPTALKVEGWKYFKLKNFIRGLLSKNRRISCNLETSEYIFWILGPVKAGILTIVIIYS